MATGAELVDQAWDMLRRLLPRYRRDCSWAMDRATWIKLVTLTDPKFRFVFERHGPQGDTLFGEPVVVTDQVEGLHLVSERPHDQGIDTSTFVVPPHPRTKAIDDEFGWSDAHVVTF